MNLQYSNSLRDASRSLSQPPKPGQPYSRSLLLSVLRAALIAQEYHFSSQAALQWLAFYPGDLEISLIYARSLIGEGCLQSAIPILKGLCQADPEYLEAVELLVEASSQYPHEVKLKEVGKSKYTLKTEPVISDHSLVHNWIVALQGSAHSNEGQLSEDMVPKTPEAWGNRLAQVRMCFEQHELETAESKILSILGENPNTPLVAVTHLKILAANPDAPLQAKRTLAEHYHRQWPDCLACTLFLATWLMDESDSGLAVTLLHEAASRDVGGQVAIRMWGSQFRYRSLWPEQLELNLDCQIPATVAGILGWNRLTYPVQAATAEVPAPMSISSSDTLTSTDSIPVTQPDEIAHTVTDSTQQGDKPALKVNISPVSGDPPDQISAEEILVMKKALERLAKGMKRPDLAQVDGRLPVYIIFSLRSKLVEKYGSQAAADLEQEMSLLAHAIEAQKKNGRFGRWGARIYFADQAESTKPLGLSPSRSLDPWGLKLSLVDLDAALSKRGEMIGALLIVGGPEIVPFHHLPNPVDDQDLDIASDNPYASRDDNYFIPEWPVGRLPDGNEENPQFLINIIRQLKERYNKTNHSGKTIPRKWLDLFLAWLRSTHRSNSSSLGYSAAIWRLASLSVFRPIGDPRSLLVSPPMAVNGQGSNGKLNGNLPDANLGYFNLHGLADASEWYGQRDPLSPGDGPDYPIALRPQDISATPGAIPSIVFSEACYGAHILDKSVDQAIALKLLASGCLAVVGSSCMSYGSIMPPLIGADLLGNSFWKLIKDGQPVGEALRHAKIQLANDMHQRQGYLDGEDQKTLVSFILYGDPLIQLNPTNVNAKSLHRMASSPKAIKTVCDRAAIPGQDAPVPVEITAFVKKLVASHLPGMSDAELTYTVERATCEANGHVCPTSQIHSKAGAPKLPNRRLITLSKQFNGNRQAHLQVARLTLDASGKLVKMAVSR